MKYEIKKWNSKKFGEMNFENICRKYSSDKNFPLSEKTPFNLSKYIINKGEKYSIRWNRYEFDANFSGQLGLNADYYVLKGSCEIRIGKDEIKLKTGEWFEFPNSIYDF